MFNLGWQKMCNIKVNYIWSICSDFRISFWETWLAINQNLSLLSKPNYFQRTSRHILTDIVLMMLKRKFFITHFIDRKRQTVFSSVCFSQITESGGVSCAHNLCKINNGNDNIIEKGRMSQWCWPMTDLHNEGFKTFSGE